MADTEESLELNPRHSELLLGHEAAERMFLEAFNSDRLHHAWLISGPKGVGKATLAWKIAKFLLTQTDKDDGPGLFGDDLPNEASSLNISPDHPDLHRIVSGGHGGLVIAERTENEKTGKLRNDIVIDDIRKLISFYSQTSAEGGWRVAIVDAADEMNVNAANALLKILEEPPEKSIILLLAHAPGKLLPTIKSRCRALSLSTLTEDSVKAVLAGKFPELSIEDLTALTRLSEGAPGRAIELANNDGVGLYRKVSTHLSRFPRFNIPEIHILAGELAAVKADAKYRLFVKIYLGWIERMIRQSASNMPLPEILDGENDQMRRISASAGVDRWLDLWEKMGQMVARADAVNLDRKQVIVNLFTSLSAVAR